MIIGFSGTRHGMTMPQKMEMANQLIGLKPEKFIHGDCIGADQQAHSIVDGAVCEIIIRPGRLPAGNNIKQANCASFPSISRVILLDPEDLLDRNLGIVKYSDAMIITPREMTEQNSGGTWMTYRMAINARKPIFLILPDGTTELKIGDRTD